MLSVRRYISLVLLCFVFHSSAQENRSTDRILACVVAPGQVRMYWKDDKGMLLGSLGRLEQYVTRQQQQLLFAMNGGMYQEDQSPLGLFVCRQQLLQHLNKASGSGNFYLKPNGVCYITRDNKAAVVTTAAFRQDSKIKYATQSGPMLLLDGRINPVFKQGSANLNIRNGVAVMPDGRLVFALSKVPVNFYDFALFFSSLGCRNALYLDGFVSRAYWPAQHWVQTDGNFGVMIGVVQ